MANIDELAPQIEEVVRNFQEVVRRIGEVRKAVNVATPALYETRIKAHIGYQLRRADTWAQDALIAAEGALDLARSDWSEAGSEPGLLKVQ